jgi:hypothetical protein
MNIRPTALKAARDRHHSSTLAALIYLHGGDQRQRTIGDSVSDMAQQALHEQPGYQAESH